MFCNFFEPLFPDLCHSFYLQLNNKWNVCCTISKYLLSNQPIFETLLDIVKAKPIWQSGSLNFTKRGITKIGWEFSSGKIWYDNIARHAIRPENFKRIGNKRARYNGSKLASKRKNKRRRNLKISQNNSKVFRSETEDLNEIYRIIY